MVKNDTDDRLFITALDGHPLVPVRIKAHAWDIYEIAAGSALKLPDGTCLVARDEPTLAVIGKK